MARALGESRMCELSARSICNFQSHLLISDNLPLAYLRGSESLIILVEVLL